jgi:TonB family protein
MRSGRLSMRRICAPCLALLATLAATPVVAAPPATASATPGPAPAAAPQAPPDPALAFYPAKARADGVEGAAVLKCRRNEHLALVGCVLVSETPAGAGFGAAAMAMAAQAKDNPAVDVPEAKTQPPGNIEIRFRLHPPSIKPDVTLMAHLVTPPTIVTKPTAAQVQAAYPERALSDQVEGAAIIDCAVSVGGGLTACRVLRESPGGYGFGAAALDLAADFKMKPAAVDGQPFDGGRAPIVIPFRTADPDAPLTLDVKKPGDKDQTRQ